jgi:FKBP-type peptidyl-prolyl cis-trans isomerase SlyD
MKVSKGNFVRIDYELRSGDDVIESSKKSGPVEYKHGSGQMLAGLEARLEGLGVGDEKDGVIPAAEAFGTEETQPKMSIPKESFPKDAVIDKGSRFEAKGPQGTPVTLEVIETEGEQIVARVVHPLAGKDIAFKVKVVAVRPPPPPVPSPSSAPEPVPESVADLDLVDAPESKP